jgi:nicotinamidase/pyrazinamidase
VTTVLWDVDTQHDFCLPHGRLYVPGTEEVLPAMRTLVEWARGRGIVHVASADDHELGDPEISEAPDFTDTFPPHCLRGTTGAAKVAETAQDDPVPLAGIAYPPRRLEHLLDGRREILLLKKSFDVFTNPSTERVLDTLAPERVVLFGVATDVCDDAAILGLRRRGIPVSFVTDAARGLDDARVEACFRRWGDLDVEMTTVDAVCQGSLAGRSR